MKIRMGFWPCRQDEYPRRVVFCRHAESERNVCETIEQLRALNKGTHSIGLTSRGREQAKIAGDYVRRYYAPFDVYQASTYLRSIVSTLLMFPDITIDHIRISPYIAERKSGIWGMCTPEEIARDYPLEIISNKLNGMYHHRPLYGESFADVDMRIRSLFANELRYQNNFNTYITDHGRWRFILQMVLGYYTYQEVYGWHYSSPELNSCANSSIMVLEKMDGPRGHGLYITQNDIVPWRGILPDPELSSTLNEV